ncbi:hypothetical protein [Hungatella effluvii]|uniref:hypothetical protein n=1 Tax=Hungatella effluvii TaxID=1096246 RepID=UPI002A7F3E62|nr:hypothetical protein [Hungatella effluvii]
MELRDRVVVINEDNRKRLSSLYGEMDSGDLERVVNKHLSICIDGIEEDQRMPVPRCGECEFLQCIEFANRNYYCDHENRENDMGFVGTDKMPVTSPEWCPKRK